MGMSDKIHVQYEGRNFWIEPAPNKEGSSTGMANIVRAVEERDRLRAQDELTAFQQADTVPSDMHEQVVRSTQDTVIPQQPLPVPKVIHNRGTAIVLPKRS